MASEGGGVVQAAALVEQLWRERVEQTRLGALDQAGRQCQRQGVLIGVLARHTEALRAEGKALR